MGKLSLLIIPFIILVVIIVGGYMFFTQSFSAKSNQENYQSFLIPKGVGASVIANNLEKNGFIRSAFTFKLYSQLTGVSERIQAGEYRLSPHMSVPQIISELLSSPLEVWVTIPEGLRREEIVEKFVEGLEKKEDAVEFRKEFMSESADLEGYLFPDTYLFPKEATAAQVVAKMKKTFDLMLEDFETDIKNNDLTLDEIVVLASIIERETKTDAERPMVAGVLLNRLEIGMALQADAATQYAIGSVNCKNKVECDWWVPLTREDLEINSPYNTYRFNGLPPKAIANAGLSSLRSVIKPTDNDYFYYIHAPSGQIYFGKTLDEHNANVRKYLNK